MLLVGSNIFMGFSSWLVFDLQLAPPLIRVKIEVSSLAPEYIIKPHELWFPIRLLTDWQLSIGRLCSDQPDQLHY
jgi:hypothetical protein